MLEEHREKQQVLNTSVPQLGVYDFVYENNKDYPDNTTLNYFGKKTNCSELFMMVYAEAKAFAAQGVKAGGVGTIVSVTCVTAASSMPTRRGQSQLMLPLWLSPR